MFSFELDRCVRLGGPTVAESLSKIPNYFNSTVFYTESVVILGKVPSG